MKYSHPYCDWSAIVYTEDARHDQSEAQRIDKMMNQKWWEFCSCLQYNVSIFVQLYNQNSQTD